MKVVYKAQNEVSSPSAKAATGRTLEQWYAELDAYGGPAKGRRNLTQYLFGELKVDAWWATTIVVEYEKARGVHEKDGLPKGYGICVTKALTTPPETVLNQFADGSWWIAKGARVAEGAGFDTGDGYKGVFKKVTPGKVIRFTWNGPNHHPGEIVEIKCTVTAGKTSVLFMHDRLQTRAAADGMRDAWAAILNDLKNRLA
jgi:uncharacterized protein YndB with AHSA1/START domain